MAVEETAHGTHRARWREQDGTQRARTFKRKSDAERFLRDTLTDLGRGVYTQPGASAMLVKAWATEWLNNAHNLTRGGQDTYRRDLNRYILPALGDVQLRRLSPDKIDTFLAGEDLAPSSVNRHYRTIRRMCQVAVERGKLATNPCDKVRPPRAEPAEMRFLTVDQLAALHDTISPRYRAWVNVAGWCGLRWSETVGLQQQRIHIGIIEVADQLIRRSDGWSRESPKSTAGRRRITLPSFLTDELTTHLEQWSTPGPDGLVFPNQLGAPMGHSSFQGSVFKPALRRAGLDTKIRIHDLRHTAVALAVASGAHPKAIQVRMGHASIKVTLDRYGHLFPEHDQAVADGLERLANGHPRSPGPEPPGEG